MSAPLPSSIQTAPLLGQWVHLLDDGHFQIRSGKVELGQGISAALLKVACQELGLRPDQTSLLAGHTAQSPDEGYTAGSFSVEVGVSALRHACVQMRRVFAQQASAHLSVLPSALSLKDGVFSADATAQRVSYHDLAHSFDYAATRLDLPLTDEADPGQLLSPADDAFVRVDLWDKFTGPGFVHDIVRPHMLHARVLRGLHAEARVHQPDLAALRALDGVTHLVCQGEFIALLGPDEAALLRAHEKACALVKWVLPELPAFQEIEPLLTSLPAVTQEVVNEGQAMACAQRLTQRYSKPYIAHASIGLACAVAEPSLTGSGQAGLTVWTHSQGVFKLREQMAAALGVAVDTLDVVHSPGAGCYGHNGADDVALDAAFLAHQLQVPVRVQWTRQDELCVSPMGSASLVELSAGLDPQGRITDWQAQTWSHSHLNRPGWSSGINLLGAWALHPDVPRPEEKDVTLPTGGGLRNIIPYYDLPALQVTQHFVPHGPVRVSALRSLGAYANTFAIESFMDELAVMAQVDPLEFRLRHAKDDRASHVLRTTAAAARWAQRGEGGEGQGLGLAFGRYKNRAGYCAVVVEVEVDESIRVKQVWCTVDAGRVVHRDGLLNQVEGGVMQAISWTLQEAVTWGPEGITSSHWDAYPILNFDAVPDIHITLVDDLAQPSLGAGEVAAGPVGAAIANAVVHALGVRPRHLPMTPDRLLRVIHAQA
ncbi:molybdopterin cofactor-binding domain-containing protein [Limnohabitans sp.]|uniref:xanthine dehydrogenase family protein molybdopterin-binding subunit n=1 Tax=Limnohabitans sp. TaxID=1907725 RepID=UPI0038B97913